MIEQQLHDEMATYDGRPCPGFERLRRKARALFADSCGWVGYSNDGPVRLIPGAYGTMREVQVTQDLRYPEIDHREAFTFPRRKTIQCVVTHTYIPQDDALRRVTAVVEPYGLTAIELAWSWYFPDHCTAIALLPPGASMPATPWVRPMGPAIDFQKQREGQAA